MCQWLKNWIEWNTERINKKNVVHLTLKGKFALWIVKRALVSVRRGELPLWLKILINLRLGKFKTPDGVEYAGFKVSFKW